MTDIVERLREGVWGRARRADAVIQANMQEGADEIERLRHDLTTARFDKAIAQRIVNEARAEQDEAVAALALYRAENGCTRGQRTTQWCGEAIRLREALERAADALSDAGLLDAWADARAALKETGHE
jgi:hypothetical protein